MTAEGDGYEFRDGVPIEPVTPGSTLLVAGPALSRTEDLAVSMVAAGTNYEEGALFISTNMTSKRLLAACEEMNPTFEVSGAGIVDCSGQHLGQSSSGAQVRSISTQNDLTGMGMQFSSLYESLYASAREGRVRTGLISLSSLSMYVDLRKLFQFTQTVSSRIDSADGLGVFTVDPTTHDKKEINTLTQVVDARIDVRESEDADGDLRVRGLHGQSDEWRAFSLWD